MNDQRPDPDILLTRVQAEEAQQSRGKLRSSLAPRLVSAKRTPCSKQPTSGGKEGVDVVVGWVDTHGRAETEALLAGTGGVATSSGGVSWHHASTNLTSMPRWPVTRP